MRTVILVLAMAALAVATGLSFVLTAAGQTQGSAELDFGCGARTVVASGEPTLVTCTAEARNTGSTTLQGARLEFLPAPNLPPPDLYVFWSETHDGVRSIPSLGDLTYDFGDVAPGATSTIVLEVIVRSTHDFGADASLVAQPDRREYARTTIRGSVGAEGIERVPITLAREDAATGPPTIAVYRLTIENPGRSEFGSVSAEISPGADVIVRSGGWRPSGPGRVSADLGALAPGEELKRELRLAYVGAAGAAPIAGAAPQGCGNAYPVLVVTIDALGGTHRQPVIGESAILGACGQLGGGGELSLPRGGSGPSGETRQPLRLAAAGVATLGVLVAAMGATMRRRSRRDDRARAGAESG
jgi:hypothetical protein